MALSTILSRLSLVALCGITASCATQSGQAVADWLGTSLGRMRAAIDPDKLVVPEIRRARKLIAKAPGYPAREARRTTPLLRATLREAGQVSERTQQLPGNVITALDRDMTSMKRRVAHLVAPNSLLRKTLDPERHAVAVRRIFHRLPTVLGLCRPILPGPGDPDRQTSAHPTGPQETWVQKILRRVRL